jgi:hypothetical protein
MIIQNEIQVTDEWIEKVIRHYMKMSSDFHMCFGKFNGNRDDIIREIRNETDIGKEILLMNYGFEKYIKEQEKNK